LFIGEECVFLYDNNLSVMIKYLKPVFFVALLLCTAPAFPQDMKRVLTLDQVIATAKDQSPNAMMARNRFRSSYYSYRAYRAGYLPQLTLSTSPYTYSKGISTYQRQVPILDDEGHVTGYRYVEDNSESESVNTSVNASLSQNITLTGGTISLTSSFRRTDDLMNDNLNYSTVPLKLVIDQPLNGYNRFRWERKIEPLRYEEAKRNYVVQMEQVTSTALSRFFSLASAQINLKIAETNMQNQDTLFLIAKGRYNLGTIAEDALLQMQLRYMQAQSSLQSARMNLQSAQSNLRSFLGFNEKVELELVVDFNIPDLQVAYEKALELALSNSPDILSYERQLLESQRSVAQARSQRGLSVTLNGTYGKSRSAKEFGEVYSNLGDDYSLGASIRIPVLDWGQGRNTYRNALSSRELVEVQMRQNRVDFEQQIFLQVMQFNMQGKQLEIASVADTIAQKSYEVAKQRYLIGRVSVTDLNIADTEKDAAKRTLINELSTYWTQFYRLRQSTLFDFLNNRSLLEQDFESLLKM